MPEIYKVEQSCKTEKEALFILNEIKKIDNSAWELEKHEYRNTIFYDVSAWIAGKEIAEDSLNKLSAIGNFVQTNNSMIT